MLDKGGVLYRYIAMRACVQQRGGRNVR